MHLPILADFAWPSLILEMRLFSPIPIGFGLIAEWVLLHFGFDLTWKKSAWVDVVMNTASCAAGIVVIPLAGHPMDLGRLGIWWPGFFYSFLIAVLMSTFIEAAVVKWLFKIPVDRRRLWILCGANGLSVGIAYLSWILRFSWSWFPTFPFFSM
jgi:hypothetical protein